MRIVLNDFIGRDFPVQLSRELSRRGHAVLHLYSVEFQAPKGDLVRKADDPDGFSIKGVTLGEPFQKYNFVRRRGQEIRYSRLINDEIGAFRADIYISANHPIDAQRLTHNYCRRQGIPFIFWLQDFYSNAIKSILSPKIPIVGGLIGQIYENLEKRMLRRSTHVVAITDDFLPQLVAWKLAENRISVIENWALKDKIKVGMRDNPWRETQRLGDHQVVLYTGTMGLKHNPHLILAVARKFARQRKDVRIVVTSEGPQVALLRTAAVKEGLSNLITLPFQPYGQYGDMLATADVLIAVLEQEAAFYSVPSKVLSYLCSGRAIVLSVDKNNLAAKILTRTISGIVTSPGDVEGFVAAIETFLDNPALREACGARARAYADEKFDIGAIADRFEAAIHNCLAKASATLKTKHSA